jgi:hypothetical protein
MSRNGSGTYTLPAGNPVVTGTTISSTWANSTLTNIASALTDSLAADGQTTATGNLKMGNNRITGLANAIASTDALAFGQVGTIAPQNANAVAITGGSIDGTTIGTTTRSSVKATTLDLGLSTQSVAIGQGNSSSIKNRIINGAMVIDQRNASAASANTINGYFLDRWAVEQSVTGKIIAQQNAGSVTPPTGFTNYLGITSQSAYTLLSGSYYTIAQNIEGFNVADLNWGTANAKTVTVSFWVRSSLTGTFGGALANSDATRSYPFTYTILSANTWEQKSVTIAGDTSGTWLTTNGIGFRVWLGLGVGTTFSGTAGAWAGADYRSATGATSVVGTNGATFYITGVQLEVGSQATGFEYRQYQQELALCQRYYYRQSASTSFAVFLNGFNNTTTRLFGIFNFPQMLRATPVLETTGTASNYQVLYAGGNAACTAVTLDGQTTNFSAFVLADVASGLTAGQGAILRANNTTSAYLGYSSEL